MTIGESLSFGVTLLLLGVEVGAMLMLAFATLHDRRKRKKRQRKEVDGR